MAQFGSATAVVQSQQPVIGARACIIAGSSAFVTLTCFDSTGAPLTPSTVRYQINNETVGANVAGWSGVPPSPETQITVAPTQNMLITVSRPFEVMQVVFQVTDGEGNQVNVPVSYDLLRYEESA